MKRIAAGALVDLNASIGGGDGAPDTVTVNGTERRDQVILRRSGAGAIATGLPAETRISGGEAAADTLRISTLGGDDLVAFEDAIDDLIKPVIDLGVDGSRERAHRVPRPAAARATGSRRRHPPAGHSPGAAGRRLSRPARRRPPRARPAP
jgi:hypothetical protein